MLDDASIEHRERYVPARSLGLELREDEQHDALLACEAVTGVGKLVGHFVQISFWIGAAVSGFFAPVPVHCPF